MNLNRYCVLRHCWPTASPFHGTLTLAGVAVAMAACGPAMVSPPARFAPAELSSHPTTGSVDVYAGLGSYSADDPGLFNMRGGVAYGLTDLALVQFDAAYHYLDWGNDTDHADVRGIGSVRLGAGLTPPLKRQPFRFTLGVGAGSSAAGAFISPDIGFNLGFENPYVIPFINGVARISIPEPNARVDVVRLEDPLPGEPGSGSREDVLDVEATRGWDLNLGLGFRLSRWPRRNEAALLRGIIQRGPVLMVAIHLGYMSSSNASVSTSGASLGFLQRF